jgi:hypothetical protein
MRAEICSLLLFVLAVFCSSAAWAQPASQTWDSVDLKNDLIEVQAVPEIGGRVIQYKLGDYGFFWVNKQLAGKEPPVSRLGPNGEWLNYGGDKLWPAPQGWDNENQWPGPPDPVLDGGPYTAEVKEDAVKLTSTKDKRSGIQFSRVLKVFDDTTRVSVDVTMKNIDTKPRRWGIWAVTQFDTGNRHGDGYNQNYWTYCPLNPDGIYHKGYNVLFGVVNNTSFKPDYENKMMRVHYENRVGKIGLDSPAGWVATIDATDGYVFVHRFKYERDKAYPDNSSVEFWCNGLGEFVAWGKVVKMPEDPEQTPYLLETEILSPFAKLDPGERYTYHYDWYAARIPANSPIVACSDVGVTCKPFSAKLRAQRLVLDGDFGVFYRAACHVVFLDADNNKIKELQPPAPVTPLKPFTPSEFTKLLAQTAVPQNAETVALCLYDAKGQLLGQLTSAQLQRNK